MERTQWKQERRLWNEVQMDTIYARQYDEQWGGYVNPSHFTMIERLLELCPSKGAILDAACGTGKYWSILLEHGLSVHGTDQSQQMLRQAQNKFPEVPVEHIGLQELAFIDAFDAVICVDAMEMVFPEDLPLVLANFARASLFDGRGGIGGGAGRCIRSWQAPEVALDLWRICPSWWLSLLSHRRAGARLAL